MALPDYHMEQVLITSQDINKFSENIKSKKTKKSLIFQTACQAPLLFQWGKVARKNNCLQLKGQLSKLYMWDGLWQKMCPVPSSPPTPHLWNCVLCSLTLAVPLFVGPTVQELKWHFLKIQPACWVVVLAFSVHWTVIPHFIHHCQTAAAPESHSVSYLSMHAYSDKFCTDVQNFGNMGFIGWDTQAFVYFWLPLQSQRVNNAWYYSPVTSLCYLCVICKDFVQR